MPDSVMLVYWSRSGDSRGLLLWLLLAGLAWLGGWLLATHAFNLRQAERLLAGFGLGLALSLWLANLLAHGLAFDQAFAGGALLTAGLGLALAWLHRKPPVSWRDLRAWPLLLAGFGAGWLFLRISQGLGIFDEYVHLPLISTMAAGNVPPNYFANAPVRFVYHYGFHLLGASLMEPGGLFPWSAFDLSKAILWGYAVTLVYLLGLRLTGRRWGGVTLTGLVLFAGGTRYLALLMPERYFLAADPLITFAGTEAGLAASFSEALTQTWPLDGGPPDGYAFAFLSGIRRPLVMAHAGLDILNLVLLLLAWLLMPVARGRAATLLLAGLLAIWGLTWETSYVLVITGLLALGLYARLRGMPQPGAAFQKAIGAALLSVPLALAQGGLLTEIARKTLQAETSQAVDTAGSLAQLAGFSLRWPPAITSSHLGTLPLFSKAGLLTGLLEMGPVVLFTPWITIWAWRRYRRGDWILAALLLSAWWGFALPALLTYQSNTDLPRIADHALLIWILLLGAMLWDRQFGWPPLIRGAAAGGLALMGVSGVVLFGNSLTAAGQASLSYRIEPLDARVQQETWDRLPPGSLIFDPRGWRATALTGRLTRALTGDLTFGNRPDPAWEQLRESPSVAGFLAAGFAFVYVDESWWGGLSESARAELSGPCVQVMSDQRQGRRLFRQLLDLRGCEAQSALGAVAHRERQEGWLQP